MIVIMDNPLSDTPEHLNRKMASQASIKPHAALQAFASMPDAVPGQVRGMALIDKIDQLLAEDELEATKEQLTSNNDQHALLKLNAAQMKVALAKERIDQRVSLFPEYGRFIEELQLHINQLQVAIEQHEISAKENIPFYRLLKAQVIKK
jgi:outer membrane murein-binding lipoprotein Lpp